MAFAGSALDTLHKNSGFCGLCSGNSSSKIGLECMQLRTLIYRTMAAKETLKGRQEELIVGRGGRVYILLAHPSYIRITPLPGKAYQ
jgi:hypothetical protein